MDWHTKNLSINQITSTLKQRLNNPLPGLKAHEQMAPIGRQGRDEALKNHPNPKMSAVLLLLFPIEQTIGTVLIRRKAYKGVHSQQISLPGGRQEPQDINLQTTALRETEEEVGVPSNRVEVLGQLTSLFIPPSGYFVQPYLGVLNHQPQFVPEAKEVETIFTPTLPNLLKPEIKSTGTFQSGLAGISIQAPCLNILNQQVWGATAMILNEFISIAKPD